MTEITELSAVKIIDGIKNKKFSCREVMQAHLKKISAVNSLVNAIVQPLNDHQALKLADEADQRIAKKETLGTLHGLPITIKDHIKVKDFIVTAGSVGLKHNRCTEDASTVARLKAEGAIVIGIANMPELGPAFETDNDLYGQTKNPYDTNKTPGGSSGGEAAIIACGGSALGLGSDGGGSIRIPAHFCGITGIKPTQNLIPLTGNVPRDGGLVMQFGSTGPMARNIEDLQLALPVLAGRDGIDPHAPPQPYLRSSPAVKEMRIGYLFDTNSCTPTTDTLEILQTASKLLADTGAQVAHVDFLDFSYIGNFMWETFFMGGDQGKSYRVALKKLQVDNPSPIMRRFLNEADKSKILDAFELRSRFFETDQLRMQALKHMQNYDVIITPACATPAKKHGTSYAEIIDFNYTLTFNLLGWPACVVRCGESKDKLPIGLQIAAKPWDDNLTLTVAKFLQDELGGWRKPILA